MRKPSRGWIVAGAWTLIFGANVCLPGLYGLGMFSTELGALAGMLAAVIILWLTGLVVCWRAPRVGEALLWGGGFCAVAPLVPLALTLAAWLAFTFGLAIIGEEGMMPIFGDDAAGQAVYAGFAFALTMMVAYPMLILAIVAGFIIRWLRGPRPVVEPESEFGDPPAAA